MREFIEDDLGPEGARRSRSSVVATSDQPALVRIKAAFVATAIAEFFRDQGADVLLMMDSVTRFAMAAARGRPRRRRAARRPAATRPASSPCCPRLLERAGTAPAAASITALYTVLVEGDDMNEPVADAVRGILDGHIVLSRELAHRDHYPAIDVLQSVSRLTSQLLSREHQAAGGRLRSLLAAHRRAADLIAIGAYVSGSDPLVDEARVKSDAIDAFLRQGVDDPYSRAEALDQLLALTGDGVPPPAAEPDPGLTGTFQPLPPGVEVVPT